LVLVSSRGCFHKIQQKAQHAMGCPGILSKV
jgi:hypothetical protein